MRKSTEGLESNGGFSLVELTVGMFITVVIATAMLSALMAVKSGKTVTFHNAQAMNVVRGTVETLKGTNFNAIADSVSEVSYDAGPDQVYDTGDDFKGTLTVAVRDALDMDGDADTDEAQIDVSGDGTNDPFAKPVRVSLQWTEHLSGQDRNLTVTVDTLIAS